MPPQTTRPADEDARGTATRTLRLRRLLSPVVAFSGVTLLVTAARSASQDRRRAAVFGLAGGGLLAAWVRRQGPPTANDPEAPTVSGRDSAGDGGASDDGDEDGSPEVVDDGDDASDVVAADDDVPAPDVDETDDRM